MKARELEQSYLTITGQLGDLLQKKAAAFAEVYAISDEIERLHGQLMDLGLKLGWFPQLQPRHEAPAESRPEKDDKLRHLHQQIEDLRMAFR